MQIPSGQREMESVVKFFPRNPRIVELGEYQKKLARAPVMEEPPPGGNPGGRDGAAVTVQRECDQCVFVKMCSFCQNVNLSSNCLVLPIFFFLNLVLPIICSSYICDSYFCSSYICASYICSSYIWSFQIFFLPQFEFGLPIFVLLMFALPIFGPS